MKILIIAGDFPPVLSPQSLRWAYLARELQRCGNDVHVLAPETTGAADDVLGLLDSVTVHRSFPGLFCALLKPRRRRTGGDIASTHAPWADAAPRQTTGPTLNWKGRVAERLKAVVGYCLFPDIRAEWNPWARRALRRLVRRIRPEVVISSHEPANTIALGRYATRRGGTGVRWVVDMGDPVLAPYTPRRWHKKALATEAEALRRADLVLVTSERARALLHQRHGVPSGSDKIHLLTQGFDDQFPPSARLGVLAESDCLELLYTGNFYSFRRADLVLEALASLRNVRLTVVTANAPLALVAWARQNPESLRLLGQLPHRSVLALQRQYDVMVNIANDDPAQVPGKFYEYLGARRPILHVTRHGNDAVSEFLLRSGQAESIVTTRDELTARLAFLADAKHSATGLEPFVPRSGSECFSWRTLGRGLHAELQRICGNASIAPNH